MTRLQKIEEIDEIRKRLGVSVEALAAADGYDVVNDWIFDQVVGGGLLEQLDVETSLFILRKAEKITNRLLVLKIQENGVAVKSKTETEG